MQNALSPSIDANAERLLSEKLDSRPRALPARELKVEAIFAACLVTATLALALAAEPERTASIPLIAAFALVYAALSRVEFRLGDGMILPTQLLLLPMLLLLPTPFVPLLIVAAQVASATLNLALGRISPQRIVLAVNDAAFALAPAIVLIALDAETPHWSLWPAYLAALLAQFAADAIREPLRSWLACGLHPRVVLAEMAQTYRVDALLDSDRPAGRDRRGRRARDRAAGRRARPAAGGLLARARGPDRADDRARRRLPRHGAAAARPARGR